MGTEGLFITYESWVNNQTTRQAILSLEFSESDSDSFLAFEYHPFAGKAKNAEGGGEWRDAVRKKQGGVGERGVHAVRVGDGGFIFDWVV